MSSSTSSSDTTRRTRTLCIGLMLIAALVLVEWGSRATWIPGTSDLERYRAFPERARTLAVAPAPSIAFVGNSVTDRVRLDVLRSEWMALTGDRLSVDKFIAYDSNLMTWYWMSEQYFWKRDVNPDLLVITYYDGNRLADSEVMEVGNLALFYTDPEDRATLFAHDLKSVEQRADYLLSSTSEAFAARDRIRSRVLNFVPGFRPFATQTNALNFEHERRLEKSATRGAPTFRTLARFLERARQAGVQVCFVAFPMRPVNGHTATYVANPPAIEMIEKAGMLHLDMRDMDELTADMYKDNVHLNARGTPIYTRKFAQELKKVWRPG